MADYNSVTLPYTASDGQLITELDLFPGDVATATTVNDGGTLFCFGGSTTEGTTLNGGDEILSTNFVSGATANDTTVNSGTLYDYFGDTASGTTVNSTGSLYVEGTAIDTTLSGGGSAEVNAGTAIDTTVNPGSTLDVTGEGGTANGVVLNGGTLSLRGDVTLENLSIVGGGTEAIGSGSAPSGLVLGGNPSELTMLSLLDGGTASGTTVNSGGMEFISGGSESGGHVLSGGSLTISGGTAAISADAGATVTFAGPGGDLITNQPDFAAVISGFGAGDLIDLANFQYSPGTQVSFKNGSLTLTHGKALTQLTLAGSYAARNFELSSDGSGGTLIAFRQPPGQA